MVDTSELEQLVKELQNLAGPVLEGQFQHDVLVTGKEIQKVARRLAPYDTNAMRLSIEVSVTKDSAGYAVEVGPTQPYGKYVEYGTRPHKVSPAALSGWAKRKGLNPFAVAKAIERKGTRAHPFMQPALEQSDSFIDRLVDAAISNALKLAFKVS